MLIKMEKQKRGGERVGKRANWERQGAYMRPNWERQGAYIRKDETKLCHIKTCRTGQQHS